MNVKSRLRVAGLIRLTMKLMEAFASCGGPGPEGQARVFDAVMKFAVGIQKLYPTSPQLHLLADAIRLETEEDDD